MFRLISEIIGFIALLALIGFLSQAIYTVTIGLYKSESFRVKLNYLEYRSILFMVWSSILIVYFFPDQAYLKCFAFFAAIINLSIFFRVLFEIPIIAIGKMTRVYFKNGEIKTYFPPRYSYDNENYYFQIIKGGKEAVKKDSVEKIEEVRIRNIIPDLLKPYRNYVKKDKLGFFYLLSLQYDIAILSVIFMFVILIFLI